MTIALICPTRRRPEQFKRMMESTGYTANKWPDGSIVIYVGGNENEKTGDISYDAKVQYPIDISTVYMWNDLCCQALKNKEHKLFMLAADDMIFSTPGWDEALIDHYNKLENKIHVYHLQDSRDINGTPHPIVTREFINAMGYFVCPIFLHWYVDSWICSIARANNIFTHLKDYSLVHDKPSDKGEADETYNRIRRMGWRERDKYVNDTCQHFLDVEKKRLAHIIMDKKLDECLAEIGAE